MTIKSSTVTNWLWQSIKRQAMQTKTKTSILPHRVSGVEETGKRATLWSWTSRLSEHSRKSYRGRGKRRDKRTISWILKVFRVRGRMRASSTKSNMRRRSALLKRRVRISLPRSYRAKITMIRGSSAWRRWMNRLPRRRSNRLSIRSKISLMIRRKSLSVWRIWTPIKWGKLTLF